MINGTLRTDHGEADASSHSATPASLEDVCAALHAQLESFLAAVAPDDVTKRTQEQTRIALGVIEQALRDFQ